jgi:hypothetical protein
VTPITSLSFFKIFIAIPGSKSFYLNFRIFVYVYECCWDLNRDCIKYIDHLEESWHFHHSKSSNIWASMFWHLFRLSLIFLSAFSNFSIQILYIFVKCIPKHFNLFGEVISSIMFLISVLCVVMVWTFLSSWIHMSKLNFSTMMDLGKWLS